MTMTPEQNRSDEPSSDVPVSASPAADGWKEKAAARASELASDDIYGLFEDLDDDTYEKVGFKVFDAVMLALEDHAPSAAGQSLAEASEDGSSHKNYPPSQAVGGWRLAELMRAADAPEPERPGRFDLSMNDAVIRWEAWASAKAKFTEACVAYVRAMISAAPPPPEGQS